MRLRPLHHSIIVEQEPKKEETQNGIYITGDHRTFRKGKVLEVGKDVEYYNKGDTVMYVKEAAEEIVVDEGLPTEIKCTIIFHERDVYVSVI